MLECCKALTNCRGKQGMAPSKGKKVVFVKEEMIVEELVI
jgi:hypothetical protein